MTEGKIKIQIKKKIPDQAVICNQCFKNKIIVDFQDKTYLVLVISTETNGVMKNMPFIIDYDDYSKIKDISWCRVNHYIGHILMIDGHKTVNYIHQQIMAHSFDGKLYIDHINRIPQDNRKANLRLASQTQQNWNQKKRKRTLKLPEDCGFEPDGIPTNIEYHPEYGQMGSYFEVVIKVNGERVFRKKTTKSKKFTLLQKLNEAKIILRDLMAEKPEWFENRCINGQLTEEGNQLYESYFQILKLAQVEDPFNQYLPPEERNIDPLNVGDGKNVSYKHSVNMPPPETGIDKLPKYCRYISASETRGDYFEYEKKTETDGVTYRTSTSKNKQLTDKFCEFICYLDENKILEW